jgi:hypothetical protein
MDTLLSLPLLSIFLLPSLTSYGTSLNLLFFYFTWTTLVLSHSALKIEFISTLAVRSFFLLLPTYLFLAFDTLLPGVAANFKEHGAAAIPTNERRSERGRWIRVVALNTCNVLLGVAAQVGIEYLLTKTLKQKSALRIVSTLPMPIGMLKDLCKGFALREVLPPPPLLLLPHKIFPPIRH